MRLLRSAASISPSTIGSEVETGGLGPSDAGFAKLTCWSLGKLQKFCSNCHSSSETDSCAENRRLRVTQPCSISAATPAPKGQGSAGALPPGRPKQPPGRRLSAVWTSAALIRATAPVLYSLWCSDQAERGLPFCDGGHGHEARGLHAVLCRSARGYGGYRGAPIPEGQIRKEEE